eukprot:GHVT01016392.1.p1 GENE.GHVT01016392.1~~GHVT01016392.1.p1  ORF type:complete len:388 (-),score=86.93 GHVT01016392.1:559-1722(-)
MESRRKTSCSCTIICPIRNKTKGNSLPDDVKVPTAYPLASSQIYKLSSFSFPTSFSSSSFPSCFSSSPFSACACFRRSFACRCDGVSPSTVSREALGLFAARSALADSLSASRRLSLLVLLSAVACRAASNCHELCAAAGTPSYTPAYLRAPISPCGWGRAAASGLPAAFQAGVRTPTPHTAGVRTPQALTRLRMANSEKRHKEAKLGRKFRMHGPSSMARHYRIPGKAAGAPRVSKITKLPTHPILLPARRCMLLGKMDNLSAIHRSFSNKRVKRPQHVNLHWKRLWWEEEEFFVRLRISTKGLKTIKKLGLQRAAEKFKLNLKQKNLYAGKTLHPRRRACGLRHHFSAPIPSARATAAALAAARQGVAGPPSALESKTLAGGNSS